MVSGSDHQIIFIVGNARSGTTMIRRVLGNNPSIHAFEELHFFEQQWSTADKNIVLDESESIRLASKLIFIQREGYHGVMNEKKYWHEASDIVRKMQTPTYPHEIFREFLHYEASVHGKTIPCEKTPQDVFYMGEILELFPNAKIINMVRDPRGILLSQKRKWLRRNMGASEMPVKEQLRLRINYHPITMSKLWNSAQAAALKYTGHMNVHTVLFENLLHDPENEVRQLCKFLQIEFNDNMLKIPQIGSSNEADKPNNLGIKAERGKSWEVGGLNDAEVSICQTICKNFMQQYGYEMKDVDRRFSTLLSYYTYYITFPIKISLALLINLHRMKNVGEAIRRRIS